MEMSESDDEFFEFALCSVVNGMVEIAKSEIEASQSEITRRPLNRKRVELGLLLYFNSALTFYIFSFI